VGIIQERLDAVQHLGDAADLLRMIRDLLRRVPDLERSLSRLALERGGPRDIAAIREALRQAGHLADALGPVLPALLADARAPLEGHEELVELLDAALVAEPPNLARDGGFVAPRYLAELDEARQLRDEGKGIIGMLQSEYARNTGIGSLKIRHNNVLGFFVEVSSIQGPKLLDPQISHTFVHRQTTANAVRFTTLALSEIETKMLNAGQRALEMEMRIFEKLRSAIIQRAGAVAAAADALAEIDVAAGFAELARVEGWTRPYVDEGTSLSIAGGRHPVVERALRQRGGNFIANDCNLGSQAPDARRLWLLTGPNMGGKSTFLRQNALIALIAQTGSFVPATSVHLGVVDQLFSRVGAADDLARGRSTFMVEMVETAAILNQAGPRALVILDEVGRGTATYDGLSIAWATLEHLHDVNRCRTLFATHYHELTALSARLPGLRNATLAVREWHSDVIFLHEVREGVADRSYGVQVARLAGLPASVVGRAREVLKALEEGERNSGGKGTAVDDLPLFSQHAAVRETTPSEIEQRLLDTMPDDLSPRDALALIYELRAAVSN
jgi:DNA mismatch repair protein MutS